MPIATRMKLETLMMWQHLSVALSHARVGPLPGVCTQLDKSKGSLYLPIACSCSGKQPWTSFERASRRLFCPSTVTLLRCHLLCVLPRVCQRLSQHEAHRSLCDRHGWSLQSNVSPNLNTGQGSWYSNPAGLSAEFNILSLWCSASVRHICVSYLLCFLSNTKSS